MTFDGTYPDEPTDKKALKDLEALRMLHKAESDQFMAELLFCALNGIQHPTMKRPEFLDRNPLKKQEGK
jgi:hypothetical protein